MTEDILNTILRRLDALDAQVRSHTPGIARYELNEAVEAARKDDKATLQRLQDEVRELRAQLSSVSSRAVSKSDVAATVNRATRNTAETIAEVVAQETLALEQRTDDAMRAVAADARKAQQAAAASIDHATKAFAEYCAELGA